MNNLYEVSRVDSVRSNQPVRVTLAQIVEEIRGPRHAEITARFRATKEERKRIAMKSCQPCFIPAALFEGGRNMRCITRYTGLMMVDMDHIDETGMTGIRQKIREDPHTLLAYVTLSGKGIRIVARTEGVTRDNFTDGWNAVNNHYATLTGCSVDPHCKDATRLSAICHDAEAFYRPDALPFPVPPAKEAEEGHSEKRKTARNITARRCEKTVLQLLEKEECRYEEGNRNRFICRCLYLMNRFGVKEEDAQQWALKHFRDYDDLHHNVAGVVRSVYQKVDEHATLSLDEFRKTDGKEGRRTRSASIGEVEEFVRSQCDLRYNDLAHILELRWKEGEGSEWIRVSDREENTLWCIMQRHGVEYDMGRLRQLLYSDFVPHFNPLREYLDSLPPWDGKTDHIACMAGMVHCKHATPQCFLDYFRRWLVCMVATALYEQVVNHEILALVGPQGCYKTSFMRHILPPELRVYYTQKSNAEMLSKDDRFTLTERILVNMEEIDVMSQRELNQLKSQTSNDYLYDRPAYGRNKVRRPFTASLCATGNNPQFLNDDSGNRRFLTFEVERIDDPWSTEIPYKGIYAQADFLLHHGFQFRFTGEEVKRLIAHNRRYEAPNPAREMLLTHYRKPTELEKGCYVTASQVVNRFSNALRLSATAVGRAFNELGFDGYRTKHGRFWLVVERTHTEAEEALPEPTDE